MNVQEHNTDKETMSDLTHELTNFALMEDEMKCLCEYCRMWVAENDEDQPCPEHPDRQREDDDEQLHHAIVRKTNSVGDDHFECMECEKTFHELDRAMSDGPCPDRQPAEDDDPANQVDCPENGCEVSMSSASRIRDHVRCQHSEDDDDGEPDITCHTDDVDESAGVDDGKGNVSREIAERFMDGESIVSIQSDDPSALKGPFEQAIRDHCEFSDGVCEWTEKTGFVVRWETDCGDAHQFYNGGVEHNHYEYCPYCGREIEIITDEGGGYEAGDLIEVVEVEGYDYIYEVSDDRYRTIGSDDKVWFPKENFTKHADKIGSFAPNDDALERVNPEAKGELLVLGNKGVYLWPFIESGGAYVAWNEMGEAVNLQPHEVTRTGIVLSFSEIAEVSDEK